jgi:hypothetical protein
MHDMILYDSVFLLGLVYGSPFQIKELSWHLQPRPRPVKRKSNRGRREISTGATEALMVTQNGTVPGNIVVAAIFLTLLIIQSCTARPNLVIHQSDTLSVVFRELPGGYPSITPVHHPYTIPPETVFDILESLTYDAGALLPFSKAQPQRLFTKPHPHRP